MSDERTVPAGTEGEPGGDDLDLDLDLDTGEPPDPDAGSPELEGDEPAEPEDSQEPAARTSRPGRRERQEARDLRELRARVEQQERELYGFRTQQQAAQRPDPVAETRRAEQEFQNALAQVPFEHQAAFAGRWWAERYARENQQHLLNTQVATAAALDQHSWHAACRMDPTRAAFAPQVERVFQERLAAGRADTRETIFHALFGMEADRQRTQRSARQREAAAGRVRSQTTRPTGARSDGSRPSARAPADSYEAALERIKGRPLW